MAAFGEIRLTDGGREPNVPAERLAAGQENVLKTSFNSPPGVPPSSPSNEPRSI
jgi:hypothetical protein